MQSESSSDSINLIFRVFVFSCFRDTFLDFRPPMVSILGDKIKIPAIIFFAAIILAGCVSTREAAKKEVLRLDAQHFKDTTTVKKVSSGNVTEFSTLEGYRPEKYMGIPWLDSFLIGYLDNQTGKRSYQVYQFISYPGRSWRLYNRVTYRTPDGTPSKPLTRLHRELLDCASSRGCTYEEHVVFDIDKGLMKKIAELAPETQGKTDDSGKITAFLYQLSPEKGNPIKYWLLPEEVAGLLEKMDEFETP